MTFPYALFGNIQFYIIVILMLITTLTVFASNHDRKIFSGKMLLHAIMYYAFATFIAYHDQSRSLTDYRRSKEPLFLSSSYKTLAFTYFINILLPISVYGYLVYRLYKPIATTVSKYIEYRILYLFTFTLLCIAATCDILRWPTVNEVMGIAGNPEAAYRRFSIHWHIKFHYVFALLPFVCGYVWDWHRARSQRPKQGPPPQIGPSVPEDNPFGYR